MSLPTYEWRTYTLATSEAAEAYATQYYPKHVTTLRELYGVTVHGFWTVAGSETPQFSVLLSYPPDADPDHIRNDYRTNPAAFANMAGFDPSMVRGVSFTMLEPAEQSPLH